MNAENTDYSTVYYWLLSLEGSNYRKTLKTLQFSSESFGKYAVEIKPQSKEIKRANFLPDPNIPP